MVVKQLIEANKGTDKEEKWQRALFTVLAGCLYMPFDRSGFTGRG